VTLRRFVLVAVLLYVSLDLSLPMMPGAFVFDVGDSVESVQIHRGRLTTEVPPTLARDSWLASQPRVEVDDHRLVRRRQVTPLGRPVVNVLPRAALNAAPSSEDPH
jgi:hypothetical protein